MMFLKRAASVVNCTKIPRYPFSQASAEKNERISDNFEEEFKRYHTPLSLFQRSMLAVGSAAVSILDPTRHDMIACLGEVTGDSALKHILNQMENSEEGRQILKERPRINTKTVDVKKLSSFPEGTLGKTYSDFLIKNNVTPDSRAAVQFIDDINLAYVIQRYREVHDLFHTALGMPTNMLGEVTVKWVEAIQTKLPMCIGGAIFGAVRLGPKHRKLYLDHYLPWAIRTGLTSEFLMNIYFEKRWEQPLNEFYQEVKIKPLDVNKIKRK